MDFGTSTNVSIAQSRSTTAIGDRDIGQKGSFYRRNARKKKNEEKATSSPVQTAEEKAHHTIDIRV